MTFSWTLDGLEGRLKEHGEFIESVISLIPPKYYFKNDPGATEEENKYQPNKRRKFSKQVIKEQKRQAKKQKLDPNNLKTVQDIQKEKLDKIRQEKRKEKEQDEEEEDDEDDDEEDEGIEDNNDDDRVDNKEDSDEEQVKEENDDEDEDDDEDEEEEDDDDDDEDVDDDENEESNNESQSDSEDDINDEFDEEDKTKIDPTSRSVKKEPKKLLSISDRLDKIILSEQRINTNFSKKEKRKTLNEVKKQEKKLKRKQSKINKNGNNQTENGEKNVTGNIKKGGGIKKNGDIRDTKSGDIKKSKGIKRRIDDDDIEEISQQKNGGLQFTKFDFADGRKKKKKINDVHLINKLQNKIEKVEELKKKDPEKAVELHEKEAWSKVFKRAQGEKVKDDPKLLKKTIKKKIIRKKKSEKAWIDRNDSVKKSMAERQQKRTENIQARIDAKKNKKKNKRKK